VTEHHKGSESRSARCTWDRAGLAEVTLDTQRERGRARRRGGKSCRCQRQEELGEGSRACSEGWRQKRGIAVLQAVLESWEG
jgi:hypothetical protein